MRKIIDYPQSPALVENTTHLSRTGRKHYDTRELQLKRAKEKAIEAIEGISRTCALSMQDRPKLDSLKKQIEELRAEGDKNIS
jgi:hypothetical protein